MSLSEAFAIRTFSIPFAWVPPEGCRFLVSSKIMINLDELEGFCQAGVPGHHFAIAKELSLKGHSAMRTILRYIISP